MITRKYKIADKVVEVTSIHAEVHEYCTDYLTNEPADYSVIITIISSLVGENKDM